MPFLYELAAETTIIGAKLSRPLTTDEKEALRNAKGLLAEKTHLKLYKIEATPTTLKLYYGTRGFFIITMSTITAIAIISAAIGLPVTAWFITHPTIPEGPLGLPVWFWVGAGIGIPIIGLALTVWLMKR